MLHHLQTSALLEFQSAIFSFFIDYFHHKMVYFIFISTHLTLYNTVMQKALLASFYCCVL